jgi:hypothetical protein
VDAEARSNGQARHPRTALQIGLPGTAGGETISALIVLSRGRRRPAPPTCSARLALQGAS